MRMQIPDEAKILETKILTDDLKGSITTTSVFEILSVLELRPIPSMKIGNPYLTDQKRYFLL